MTLVKICTLSEVKEKGRKLIEFNEQKIILFFIKGEVYAVNALCPHRGGPLEEGELNEYEVTCPWHGFSFDLKTGESFMTSSKIKVYKTKLDGDNLFIEI